MVNAGTGQSTFGWVIVGLGTPDGREIQSLAEGLSTSGSWKGSEVVENDKWYYTSFHIGINGVYESRTATGAYPEQGGAVFHVNSGGRGLPSACSLVLQFTDVKGGSTAFVVLGEAWTTAAPASE